jgi:hypothetical protein
VINRNVRRELFKKLPISPQAMSQRANRIKEQYGPMTTDEAVYVIAHTKGVDLSKYLPLDVLDRVRALIPRDIKPEPIIAPTKQKKVASRKKKRSLISYPLVKESFIQDAVAIGEEAFPQVVVLENSIRNLIEKRLSAKAKDWQTTLVPPAVQKNVQRTMDKEKKFPYREKRGHNFLMYCNFSDLKNIVIANESDFRDVIVDLEWFKVKMDEVYMARNNLAHSVLLTSDDRGRIALFYRDWARLLESAQVK